jgi:hypothetical protein
MKDRRSEARFPFMRSVSIQMDGNCYSAFTRESSASAIGLLHNIELPLGEVEIVVAIKTGQKNSLSVRIEQCEPCGDGWYISGGPLIGLSATGA